MGGLAAHVAWIAENRHPHHAVPEGFFPAITRMALMGTDLARGVSRLVVEPDADAALAFADRDETIDAAHRDLFTTLLTRDARYDTQTAIDITLLGRYYERFADHAVAIARRLDFAAAGAPLRATARPIGSTA